MQKKKAFMVATAHLDTVWRWPLCKTVEEYIPDTLTKNFDLLEKYREYVFNFEGAYRYELIEEYYPRAFEIIKDYVEKNRWNPCGSEYENSDVNIPSPEATARNIMLGNNYFYEKFGKKCSDIFLPDCFGFGSHLPQIVASAGLCGFTTQKLTWGSSSGIPFNLGIWKGADGSKISASFNPKSYRYKLSGDIRADVSIIDGIAKSAVETNYFLPWVNHLYGTGDIGGAPTEESVKGVSESIKNNAEHPDFEVISAKSEDIHNEINRIMKTQNGKNLPVYSGDLLMTSHGAGCYTSRCHSKRLDYQCEQAAHTAEYACTFASLCSSYKYPKDNLNKAWKRMLKHQFHDDITGTAIMEVYNDSWDDYYASISQFSGEFTGALQALAHCMDTSWVPENGIAVAVSNPTQFRRREPVGAKIRMSVNTPFVKVIDKQKQETPSQVVKKSGKEFEIVFTADTPSFATHIYAVVPSDSPCKIKTELSVSEHTLENSKYKIKLNKNGDIAFLYDKELCRQVIKKPIKMALLSDTGSLAYPSWEIRKEDIDKEPYCYANTPEFEIYENGPSRVSIKVTREIGYSTVCQIISLYPDSQALRVDNIIDWRTRRSMLKAVFPLASENITAKYANGLGYTERGTNTDSLYEVPAQGWAEITDKSGDFGITVLTDSKHGFDKPDSSTLRLTCIHTPAGAFTEESRQDLQDIGRNCFSFGLYAHSGDLSESDMQSQIFMRNLICCAVPTVKGKSEFSQVASLLKISSNKVIIRALKIAENDDNSLILRLNNPTPTQQKNIAISLFRECDAVEKVTTSEDRNEPYPLTDKRVIRANMAPFETLTLKISFTKNLDKTDKQNEYLPTELDYNSRGFTRFGDDMKHIILQGAGFSLPRELINSGKIVVNKIPFHFQPDEGARYDVLVCRGQKIDIKPGFETLYFLAGAAGDNDIEDTFVCGKSECKLKIKSMTAPYSKWDMYALNQKASVDENTVFGFEFTHLHHPEGNLVKKARIYLYSLNVKNKKTVTLPENNKLVIFAATLAEKAEYIQSATQILDKADESSGFGEIPPIDKITDKTEAITIRAGKIQEQAKNGKGKGFKRDNIITNIIRSYTKSEW